MARRVLHLAPGGAMRVARSVRLDGDAAGEAHVEAVAVPLAAMDSAPPTRPMSLSTFRPAVRWARFELSAG